MEGGGGEGGMEGEGKKREAKGREGRRVWEVECGCEERKDVEKADIPVITLDLRLLHGIVFIQIKSNHIGKRKAIFLVQADELFIHGSGGGPSGQAQHTLVRVRANTISYGLGCSLACILWGPVDVHWYFFSYAEFWSNLQYVCLSCFRTTHF
jgi:hypothetical protein